MGEMQAQLQVRPVLWLPGSDTRGFIGFWDLTTLMIKRHQRLRGWVEAQAQLAELGRKREAAREKLAQKQAAASAAARRPAVVDNSADALLTKAWPRGHSLGV